jgi:ubiquinone/menaquinone biosynthesis C-methylase UbiE
MAIIKKLGAYFGMGTAHKEKDATEAYDLWAPDYDQQPQNLMLRLDAELFNQLLDQVPLHNKSVIDIGCGTGRHWEQIFVQSPAQLAGYDVSDGMLTELKKKYPEAEVQLATDNDLSGVPDRSVDVLISTLTIAHIENLERAFAAWSRVLKTGGALLITDFHPQVLAEGGRRDFISRKKRIVIRNYVHHLDALLRIARQHFFHVEFLKEKYIDESVKKFYEQQQALHVFERFRGKPIIYGLYLSKYDPS